MPWGDGTYQPANPLSISPWSGKKRGEVTEKKGVDNDGVVASTAARTDAPGQMHAGVQIDEVVIILANWMCRQRKTFLHNEPEGGSRERLKKRG